jgi:AraC family transcriptional regulator, arabinose operon regulatory protein
MDRRVSAVILRVGIDPWMSIPDLAHSVNLSVSRLEHLFQMDTACRLSDLIKDHRLEWAARRLRESEERVKEIACAAGYQHTSSFCRAFRRRFRQSPKIYRTQ